MNFFYKTKIFSALSFLALFLTLGCQSTQKSQNSKFAPKYEKSEHALEKIKKRINNKVPLSPEEATYFYLVANSLLEKTEYEIDPVSLLLKIFESQPSEFLGMKIIKLLEDRKQYEEALSVSEKLRVLVPQKASSYAINLQLLLTLNKIEEALHIADIAINNLNDKEKEDLIIIKAQIYLENGKNQEAMTFLEKKLSPNYPNVNLFYAKLLWQEKQTNRAINIVKSLVKEYPQDIEAWKTLAYFLEGNNNYPEAFDAWEKAWKIKPDFESGFRLANYFLAGNDSKKAKDILIQLENITNDEELKFVQAKLAKTLIIEKLYTESEQRLEILLNNPEELPEELKKDIHELTFFLGYAQQKQKKYQKAIESYKKIPYNTMKMHIPHLIMCLLETEQVEEAIQLTAELPLNTEEDFLNAIDIFMKLGKHAQAQEIASQGLKKYPDSIEIEYALLTSRPILQLSLQEIQKHVEKMYAFLKKRPQHHEALNYTAYIQAIYNINLQTALQQIKKALNFSPNNPYYLDTLALIYLRLKKIPEAAQTINKALELYNKDNSETEPILLERQGDILLAQNKPHQAYVSYRSALKILEKKPKWRITAEEEWRLALPRLHQKLNDLQKKLLIPNNED